MHHFAVIGNPISHSLSPTIHHQFAKQCGIDISYEKICAPLDGFAETVNALRQKGFTGANVTTPFKQAAFTYADFLTARAKLAGAVNTLVFKNNQCIGDNTDGIGLLRDLEKKNIEIKNTRILILGAGGAARGIIPALQSQHPQKIAILNRTEDKAIALAKALNCDIYSKNKEYDLIINTTNANFEKNNIFECLENLSHTNCYDLNYGERHKTFKHWAKEKNTKSCHEGLGMLIEQAAESFFVWTGLKPKSLRQDLIYKN